MVWVTTRVQDDLAVGPRLSCTLVSGLSRDATQGGPVAAVLCVYTYNSAAAVVLQTMITTLM